MHKLKLYVSGDSGASKIAYSNLVETCDEELGDAYELEVIDVLENPHAAAEAGVRCTPTVVRVEPAPERMALGNLSDRARLLRVLGVETSRPKVLLPGTTEHGTTTLGESSKQGRERGLRASKLLEPPTTAAA